MDKGGRLLWREYIHVWKNDKTLPIHSKPLIKKKSEHCVGKALFWSCEAILDFLNFDHSTTLWSRLNSTNIQIFRLFQRLLLKFTLFQICISHWICQYQLQWTLITNYLQWIRKFKSQAFTTNLFFLNQQLYNTVVPCYTNVFLDIIVEIQDFLDFQYSLNLLIWREFNCV